MEPTISSPSHFNDHLMSHARGVVHISQEDTVASADKGKRVGGTSQELVGVLVAINKRSHIAGGIATVGKPVPFSLLDEALLAGVAGQLGAALKLAVRHAMLHIEQDGHVASMTKVANIMAGLRMVNQSLQSAEVGSMWGEIEAHAARLVDAHDAQFFLRDGKDSAVRRQAPTWEPVAVNVR
jgi:hypothetical protein